MPNTFTHTFTWTLLASLWLNGCAYDLDLEGKRCDGSHPCPPGYSCLPDGEQLFCLRFAGDGGQSDGDGTDGDGPQACTSSNDCPLANWCNPDSQRCEPKGACQNPGVDRCDDGAVVRCDPESGYDQTVSTCSAVAEYCDPFDPACKPYCDDDTLCAAWPASSCDPSSRKCVALDLCGADQDCAIGSQCVEAVEAAGACVAIPNQDGTLPGGGPPDLGCYVGDPSPPPAAPASCDLQGRVVEFYTRAEQTATIGLVVRIHREADVLAGVTSNPIAQTTAHDDGGYGQYSLSGIPTNTPLVLEVQGRSGGADFDFASMFTFGLTLRADDCASGTISFAAPAIFQLNYDAYARAADQLVPDANRGLAFGQLRDCTATKLVGATGGVSMDHELLYYLSSGMPDLSATATDSSGFFVVANTLPIRGLAAALVRQQDVPISLRTRPIRVFAAAASLILFDKTQLPR